MAAFVFLNKGYKKPKKYLTSIKLRFIITLTLNQGYL